MFRFKNAPKILLAIALLMANERAFAFCGFYVAKADAKLFNKSSQVIITRNGERQVITMSNDFDGDAKDFAMVVPVPVVLKKEDIKVVDQSIFDKLDAYSGPRLVEYHDQNPCDMRRYMAESMMLKSSSRAMDDMSPASTAEKFNVKIEASYTIGEYDILILSAEESGGLKSWLLANGYKIPDKAEEVLDPYIKSNLKFFVVKVNLGEQKKAGLNKLRPIQIAFNSPKFMLPIRLGMANSDGSAQDLIIYAFTQKGRVETTNYKTLKIPTDANIPEFLKPKFGQFYKDLFDVTYKKDRQATYLEYAWNLNSNNYTHCDPCAGNPPKFNEFKEAGVEWVSAYQNQEQYSSRISDYDGEVFFTRLHVRYDRQNFPQDLIFQETPNQDQFQGRYIMQHAITEKITCESAKEYYGQVNARRKKELMTLNTLTGWDVSLYGSYQNEFANYAAGSKTEVKTNNVKPKKSTKKSVKTVKNKSDLTSWGIGLLLFILSISLFISRGRIRE